MPPLAHWQHFAVNNTAKCPQRMARMCKIGLAACTILTVRDIKHHKSISLCTGRHKKKNRNFLKTQQKLKKSNNKKFIDRN